MRIAYIVALAASMAACATHTSRAESDPTQGENPARTPSTAEVERVETCLSAAATPDEARDQCVGALARDCMERTRMATLDMATCASRERNAWRTLLEREAEARRPRQSEWQNTTLDEFLRVGEEWDRALCAYEASADEGGTMSQLTGSSCTMRSAADRAIRLRFRGYDR